MDLLILVYYLHVSKGKQKFAAKKATIFTIDDIRMKYWLILVILLLPLPVVSLFVLSIPLPKSLRFIRKLIIKLLDRILFLELSNGSTNWLTLYHVGLGLSSLLFFISLTDLSKEKDSESSGHNYPPRSSWGLSEEKCIRWRNERNAWISGYSLTLWLLLYRFRQLILIADKSD